MVWAHLITDSGPYRQSILGRSLLRIAALLALAGVTLGQSKEGKLSQEAIHLPTRAGALDQLIDLAKWREIPMAIQRVGEEGQDSSRYLDADLCSRNQDLPVRTVIADFVAQESSSQRPPAPSRPAPPPPFPGTPGVKSAPEPERRLVGVTQEYLSEIQQHLPAGSQIYTYPVSTSALAAAVAIGDLDGDGKPETIVVYTQRTPTREQGSLPLFISVLSYNRNSQSLTVRSSLPLAGEVFFQPRVEGLSGPLAVESVTGTDRPEIIVVSGTGASAGGALQVFSFDGSALTELTRIPGHDFSLHKASAQSPAVIVAQWQGEEKARVYVWSENKFRETGRSSK